MNASLVRSLVPKTAAVLVALSLAVAPTFAAGTIEGLVVGLDGKPAAGYRVHLIDESGDVVGTADVDRDGAYGFGPVNEGVYAFGVETGDGRFAPVAAPALELGSRQLARRDLRLTGRDDAVADRALTANYGLGSWWAGLAPAAKVWSVVAVVAAGALTVAAVDDDDEPVASDPDPTPTR